MNLQINTTLFSIHTRNKNVILFFEFSSMMLRYVLWRSLPPNEKI